MSLSDIERLAKDYSDARKTLKDRMDGLEDEIRLLKKRHLPGIRKSVEEAANRQTLLYDAISAEPEIFVRPKTVIFHGIKLGYQKAKGEIQWEDESQVIKLIKKHFPEDWENFVKVTEKVMRSSLINLSAGDLKKIGVAVVETGDEVVIRPTDGEIDKMINALLKDDEPGKGI